MSRKIGAARALAVGTAPTPELSWPSSPESTSNSTSVCVAGPPSGSFVCGEAPSSLPPPATPQHWAAAVADLA